MAASSSPTRLSNFEADYLCFVSVGASAKRLPSSVGKRVVRIFPNAGAAVVRALCVETNETGLKDNRYPNMSFLAEQKKEALRLAA